MAHAHGDGRVAIPRRTRRLLTFVSVVLGIATLIGVVLLRSPGDVGLRGSLSRLMGRPCGVARAARSHASRM